MTPFDFRDYLDLADWLGSRQGHDVSPTAQEAVLRTVISRAYYAAFHVARAFVAANVQAGVLQWPGTRGFIHDKVWDAMKAHPDPRVVALAFKGVYLNRERTEADYSIAPNKRRAMIAREARRQSRDSIVGLDALAPATP